MEFYVNEQKIDITLEDEKTIGDVLRSFEENCAQNKSTTIAINVDGTNVTAENFDQVAAGILSDTTIVKVSVVSEMQIAEAFKESSAKVSRISEAMIEVPVALQSGKDSQAHKAIAELADAIDNFCHIVTLSTLFPERFDKISINGMKLSEFFADFATILKDLNEAMANNDTALIGDLAEYEICPRLNNLAESAKDF